MEQWARIKTLLQLPDDMDAEVWRLNGRKGKPGENWEKREIIGHKTATDTSSVRIACATSAQGIEKTPRREIAITAPATDSARQWSGWGTALKPALEPITVARKPLDGTVAENVLEHGTGALNVDGCRVGSEEMPVTKSNGTVSSSNRSMSGSNYSRVSCGTISGRWPANLIHDGSEEVEAVFPHTSSGQPMRRNHTDPGRQIASGASKGGEYFHDGYGDSGSASRFFYCAKASKADRDAGCDGMNLVGPGRTCYDPNYHEGGGKLPPRTGNHHPTVKPTELMRYLCRLVTPPGGVVMDPFTGSGSTGRGAILEGFRFVGIEREAEYVAIARARIEDAVGTRRAQTAQGELGL